MPKVIKRGDMNYPSSPPAPSASPSIRPSAPTPLRPQKKSIIEKEVVSAQSEARRLIDDAEMQANRLVEEAASQADELRQKGYEEGYQEGLGRYTEQVARALLELKKKEQAIEPEYIRLVRSCVEKIVGYEIEQNPQAIVDIVRGALSDARQQREITVRVHPADAEALRKNQRRLLDALARANAIEVREDPVVARGGCIIVTELGTIDASLERQLSALEAALEEELLVGDPDEAVAADDS